MNDKEDKCLATGLGAPLSFLSTSRTCKGAKYKANDLSYQSLFIAWMGWGEESEDLGCVAIKFNWSPVWVATKNVVLCKEKNSMKGEFKWNSERLKSDFW